MTLSRCRSATLVALLLPWAAIVASWSTSAPFARENTLQSTAPSTSTSSSPQPLLVATATNTIIARQRHQRQQIIRRATGFPFSRAKALWMASTAPAEEDVDTGTAILAVEASSGLSDEEFAVLVRAVEEAYCETVGLEGISCDTSSIRDKIDPRNSGTNSQSDRLVGTLGRVLSVRTNLDEEIAECLRALIAEQMDHLIYGSGELGQPVLVSVRTASDADADADRDDNGDGVHSIIENEIDQYGLRIPVHCNDKSKTNDPSVDEERTPTLCIAIDGAETKIDDSGDTFWDTSSVLVFDDLVSNDLRARLLEVVKGKKSADDDWNDNEKGPDPSRWVRGGLQDTPDEERDENEEDEGEETMSCWGLPGEAIEEICFREHDAIQEFESILTNLFSRFVVSRLPEAVYGECVSPLTANAPVAGEDGLYDYHIDGDPLQTPPSPWTDVYGRYPNRSPGKPRFVSCLVYLNEEWDGSNWGAPTKFYDPPTGESYEVTPSPGRCVIMDQDLGHTVVPPFAAAGKRPRYSLVWKLVLHPKTENQDMTDLSSQSRTQWPEPILIGSAARRS